MQMTREPGRLKSPFSQLRNAFPERSSYETTGRGWIWINSEKPLCSPDVAVAQRKSKQRRACQRARRASEDSQATDLAPLSAWLHGSKAHPAPCSLILTGGLSRIDGRNSIRSRCHIDTKRVTTFSTAEVALHSGSARCGNRGIEQSGRLGGANEFRPAEHLREEQKRAVEHILDSRDFATNLRGAAGTGKTATLQEIDRGLREAGREVTAIA